MLRVIGDFSGPLGRLGGRSVAEITERDVETFLQHLHSQGRAASTRNHYLRIWKLMGKWAVKQTYRSHPFVGPDSDLRQEQSAQRSRRLSADEERRLMRAANPNLQRLIIAALETGARRGKLLSLQWKDVNLERRELRLRAEKTKDGEDRVLPITDRLSAVLEMASQGPDGHPHVSDAYVFGNEVGEAVASVKTAWAATCRRAGLSDLHFHDLRHEAGSRWVEGGVPIHHVQALLGHSNVKQTSTYLNVGLDGLKESVNRFERNRQSCTKLAQNPRLTPAQPFLGNDETADKPLVN